VAIAWRSGGRIIRPAQSFAANGGIVVQCPVGWYLETDPGLELSINLSLATTVAGGIVYTIRTP